MLPRLQGLMSAAAPALASTDFGRRRLLVAHTNMLVAQPKRRWPRRHLVDSIALRARRNSTWTTREPPSIARAERRGLPAGGEPLLMVPAKPMRPELTALAVKPVNCFAFGPFELIPGRQ